MSSLIICTLVALFLRTESFINPSTRHQYYYSSSTPIHHPSLSYHDTIILYSQNKSEHEEDDSDDDNIDSNDEDNALLNELRQQAQQKLGADIPNTDEFQEAAKAAENDFLAAMLEESNKFKEIKSNEGSEKACEIFMKAIQKSDEEAAAAMRRSEGNDSQVDISQVDVINSEEEEEKDDNIGNDDWQ